MSVSRKQHFISTLSTSFIVDCNKCPFSILGADSLEYLSVEGLKRAVQYNMKTKKRAASGHCTACLTGEYPGGVPEELSW